jgi:hypothetical protein
LTPQKARAAKGDGKAVVITAPVGIAAICKHLPTGAPWRSLALAVTGNRPWIPPEARE